MIFHFALQSRICSQAFKFYNCERISWQKWHQKDRSEKNTPHERVGKRFGVCFNKYIIWTICFYFYFHLTVFDTLFLFMWFYVTTKKSLSFIEFYMKPVVMEILWRYHLAVRHTFPRKLFSVFLLSSEESFVQYWVAS